ncbi:hypothetical protein [Mycobacteroides abscessus]|uniref:hypothetical protein n=1 Tax=Mycobacteroides abscessus TaxID=36809 RepID=UPI0010420F58|nr:hypothetical protein [Mycobacteroides abscessus]
MGEHIAVDAYGLHVLAARCDSSAAALASPPASQGGPPDQATSVAVSEIHQLVGQVQAAFATRCANTALAVRTAAAKYTETDEDSRQELADVGDSVRG